MGCSKKKTTIQRVAASAIKIIEKNKEPEIEDFKKLKSELPLNPRKSILAGLDILHSTAKEKFGSSLPGVIAQVQLDEKRWNSDEADAYFDLVRFTNLSGLDPGKEFRDISPGSIIGSGSVILDAAEHLTNTMAALPNFKTIKDK